MRRDRERKGRARRRRSLAGLLLLGGTLTLVGLLGGLGASGGGARAVAQSAAGEPTAQTDDSVPAPRVTMIGASPQEAPQEAWGIGQGEEGTSTLVRYTAGGGWSLGPPLLDAAGGPLTGFKLDQPGTPAPSVLAGQMTAAGSGVLVGTAPSGSGPSRQLVLVRSPGGSFRETAPIPPEGEAGGLLETGFSVFATANRAPLVAPLDEPDGHGGALLVPVAKGEVEGAVLHWDDGTREWTSEPIEVPQASNTEFQVVGIGASSPVNAWLLARLSSGEFALFRRQTGGGAGPSGCRWLPPPARARENR